MKVVAGVAAAAAVLLGIWAAVGRGASPDALPSVAGTSAPGPASTIELPDDAELPAEEIYAGEGSAMLKIDRDLDFALGLFEMRSDFTLWTLHGLVGEPENTNRVFGSSETEALLVMSGYGTAGSGHTTTATVPVTYEVEGLFHPASGACVFDLVVTETLHLSQVTSMENTLLGVVPAPEGLGDDVVTTFDVDFDEGSLDFFIIAGEYISAFTLYDIALPDGTGCNFTG